MGGNPGIDITAVIEDAILNAEDAVGLDAWFVDVPQEVVLKACLANGDDTVKKIQKAYDKCFGKDYSFDDLADTVGRDSDNDDLPDEYEANEGCFYKTMDWVKGNKVQPSVIEADMAGLPGFDSFKDDINSCSAWSGNFGGRKKR